MYVRVLFGTQKDTYVWPFENEKLVAARHVNKRYGILRKKIWESVNFYDKNCFR